MIENCHKINYLCHNNHNNIIIIIILVDFESIMVRTISERFNRDNIEVILEWVPDNSFHTYHVNITPQPAFSMKLIVTCGHPFQGVDNNSVIIEGYMDPSLEGAVLFFDCPPQHVLIGPNTTTCMGNGKWEPDPREVECKGTTTLCYAAIIVITSFILKYFNMERVQCISDIDMHRYTMLCYLISVGLDLESRTSYENLILTAAVSSSVVAFLMTSVLILATGIACGYCFMWRRRRKQSSSSNQPTEPLYDDVILNALPQPSAVEHQEQGLELKENVAYGTTKSMTHQ